MSAAEQKFWMQEWTPLYQDFCFKSITKPICSEFPITLQTTCSTLFAEAYLLAICVELNRLCGWPLLLPAVEYNIPASLQSSSRVSVTFPLQSKHCKHYQCARLACQEIPVCSTCLTSEVASNLSPFIFQTETIILSFYSELPCIFDLFLSPEESLETC